MRTDQRAVFSLLWVVFFLQGMTPGFWFPALTNILGERGLAAWVPAVFVVPPLCALISPLVGGALADQRVAADRLFAWSSVFSAVALWAAFAVLDGGWHPWWFVGLLGIYSLISGPTWGLLATVSLSGLERGERQFPLVRVGATVGWVVAGLLTSYVMRMDTDPGAGYVGAVARLAAGLLAFGLPHTPPLGAATSWASRLGLDAFQLCRERDPGVFFGVTLLFSVPLAAFYMYGPEFLKVLGNRSPTGTMTVAQVTEILAMLTVGLVMGKFRVKTVLLWALALSAARFAMSAVAGLHGVAAWHVAGIALHGVCYTFYFITAQVFLDRQVPLGLRGQAQGLLVMVSAGLGPLIGAVLCGYLRSHWVQANGAGWTEFWLALAAMIGACTLLFAAFYEGARSSQHPAPGSGGKEG